MLQRHAVGGVMLVLTYLPGAHAAELVAPYVNTVSEDVALMLDLAEVEPDDYLIDLGSGDGRIVIAAAQRGARGHGVELQPELVALAEQNASKAGVSDRVTFLEGDIFAADLSGASVVTAYLFPEANLQLRPKLLAELPPGTRVVSNAFHMGDWIPDRHEYGRTSGGAMLWIIPARIEGSWTLTLNGQQLDMQIVQHYQEIEISLQGTDKQPIAVTNAKLNGSRLTFRTGGSGSNITFNGLIDGESITGEASVRTAEDSKTLDWRATQSRKVTGSSRMP